MSTTETHRIDPPSGPTRVKAPSPDLLRAARESDTCGPKAPARVGKGAPKIRDRRVVVARSRVGRDRVRGDGEALGWLAIGTALASALT
jgi:hypothetical protein